MKTKHFKLAFQDGLVAWRCYLLCTAHAKASSKACFGHIWRLAADCATSLAHWFAVIQELKFCTYAKHILIKERLYLTCVLSRFDRCGNDDNVGANFPTALNENDTFKVAFLDGLVAWRCYLLCTAHAKASLKACFGHTWRLAADCATSLAHWFAIIQ